MAAFITITFVAFSLVATLSSAAADTTLRTRALTVSATLKSCVLVNIKTRAEKKLDGNDSFTLDESNDMGYSIRCDISSDGRLSEIKFSFDGSRHVENSSPYYMLGDKSAGKIINAVGYLSTCGKKVVMVEGFLNDKSSFTQTYKINVKNPSGVSCDSGSPTAPSPVRAPVAPPLKAPVTPPVKAPLPVPVTAPVTPPVKAPLPVPVTAPVTPPVKAPLPAPVKSPVSAPVKAPLPVPVTAPVTPPVKAPFPAPVKSPVSAPVKAPVPAPVGGSCPAKVTGYTLVDAKLGTDIMPLRSYSLSEVAELLNIRVEITACSPKVVESVYIDLDGMTRCENFAPYTAFGDASSQDLANNKAKYNGKSISPGRHIIKATPYTNNRCEGTAGRTHTLEFTVEDGAVGDDYY